ncbi:STAS domain-containing protein [Thalassobacillus sp. C254]|uniref:STAS domain-containing protein n=1 Tax=Thalassobacillus sp. C254 TaxID=1225341 RepID=UPI0006D152F7|nr:STAS domain-containing protein [Thalassobacillus sp. C254]
MGKSPSLFEDLDIYQVLNTVGENILIADTSYKLIWMNEAAKELMKDIGPFVNINDPEQFIGINISTFHGEKQRDILEKGEFPHKANISLFNRFEASIVVDHLKGRNGEVKGFLLTWKDVTEYEREVKAGQELIEELSTPIINTEVESTLLVPITGTLCEHRFETMREKILLNCVKHRSQFIIFDFTGVSKNIDEKVAFYFSHIASALRLIGATPIFAGFPVDVAKDFANHSIHTDVKTFSSYKKGMEYIREKEGYQLVKVKK